MLKIFSIFICLQLATGNLFGSELAKIPFLLTHFQEHKMENEALSFVDFFNLHYNDPQHHEQDHEKHHQLPMQHSHQATVMQLFDFQIFVRIISIENMKEYGLFFAKKITPLTEPQYFQVEVVNRLLRPPNV